MVPRSLGRGLLLDGESNVGGDDDIMGDAADTDGVWVMWAEDVGGMLLLELGKLGFVALTSLFWREHDQVGAPGERHSLAVLEIDYDRRPTGY